MMPRGPPTPKIVTCRPVAGMLIVVLVVASEQYWDQWSRECPIPVISRSHPVGFRSSLSLVSRSEHGTFTALWPVPIISAEVAKPYLDADAERYV